MLYVTVVTLYFTLGSQIWPKKVTIVTLNITMPDSRTNLLKAGLELFARNGYKSTSVRLLCEEANTTINMISHHFGGKKGLLEAIIGHYGKDLFHTPLRIIREPARSKDDFEVRLRLFSRETLQSMLDHKELMTIMYNATELSSVIDMKVVHKEVFEYQAALIEFIRSGIEFKAVKSDLNIEMVSAFLWDRMATQVLYSEFIRDVFDGPDIYDESYQDTWFEANYSLYAEGMQP